MDKHVSMPNYFEVLRLDPNATDEEIRRNFRRMALDYHPDRRHLISGIPSSQFDESHMKELNKAYSVLCDPERRKLHIETIQKRSNRARGKLEALGPAERACIKYLSKRNKWLQKYRTRSSDNSLVFLSFEQAAEEFAKARKNPEAITPAVSAKAARDYRISDGSHNDDAKAFSLRLLRAIQSGNLEEIRFLYLTTPSGRWSSGLDYLQRRLAVSAFEPNYNICEQYKPLNALLDYMAFMESSSQPLGDPGRWVSAFMEAIFSYSRGIWRGLKHFSNDGGSTTDLGQVATQLCLDQLRDGHGHPASFLKDYRLRWDNGDGNVPKLFPSVDAARKLLWCNKEERVVDGIQETIWRGWRTVGTEMEAMEAYESAVLNLYLNGKILAYDAGKFILDLLPACKTRMQTIFCFLVASKWFLNAIKFAQTARHRYILKKLVARLLKIAQSLSLHFMSHCYINMYVAGVAFACYERLAKLKLLEQKDVVKMAKYFDTFIAMAHYVPLPMLPNLMLAEVDLFDHVSAKLHSQFLAGLAQLSSDRCVVPQRLVYYYLHANTLNGIITPTFPSALRKQSMHLFMTHHQQSWHSVQSFMLSDLFVYDDFGWLKANQPLGGAVARDKIVSIRGFEIDKDTGKVTLYLALPLKKNAYSGNRRILFERLALSTAERYDAALLSYDDIAAVFNETEPSACFFSLDPIKEVEHTCLHPMQKLVFSPDSLAGSPILHTLFLADYIMKQMSLGLEISYKAPFSIRPIMEGQFWAGIPKRLQEALKPCKSRGHRQATVSRFWIQADEVEVDKFEDEDTLRIVFGEVETTVRTRPMTTNERGELSDATDGSDPNSAESQFCRDFTRCYSELGEHFPVFERLKEITKLQTVHNYVAGYRETLLKHVEEIKTNLPRIRREIVRSATKRIAEGLEIIPKLDAMIDKAAERISETFRELSFSAADCRKWILGEMHRSVFARRMATQSVKSFAEIRQSADVSYRELVQQMTQHFGELRAELLGKINEVPWRIRESAYDEAATAMRDQLNITESTYQVKQWLKGEIDTALFVPLLQVVGRKYRSDADIHMSRDIAIAAAERDCQQMLKRIEDECGFGSRQAFAGNAACQLQSALEHVSKQQAEDYLNGRLTTQQLAHIIAKRSVPEGAELRAKLLTPIQLKLANLDEIFTAARPSTPRDAKACDIVPAIYESVRHENERHLAYGGILLNPKEKQVDLSARNRNENSGIATHVSLHDALGTEHRRPSTTILSSAMSSSAFDYKPPSTTLINAGLLANVNTDKSVLSIMLMNAQSFSNHAKQWADGSIEGKQDYMISYLNSWATGRKAPNVLCITETWFNEIRQYMTSGPGHNYFNVYTKNRDAFTSTKRTGGGVCIILHKDTRCIEVPASKHVEVVALDVFTTPEQPPTRVIAVYRPPSMKHAVNQEADTHLLHEIMRLVNGAHAQARPCVVLGDFNFDPKSPDRNSEKYAALEKCGLVQQFHAPTHAKGRTLDHAYVSAQYATVLASTISAKPFVSDHHACHVDLRTAARADLDVLTVGSKGKE